MVLPCFLSSLVTLISHFIDLLGDRGHPGDSHGDSRRKEGLGNVFKKRREYQVPHRFPVDLDIHKGPLGRIYLPEKSSVFIMNSHVLGWAFGTVVKMLLGTPASHIRVSGLSPSSTSNSGFLPMHT